MPPTVHIQLIFYQRLELIFFFEMLVVISNVDNRLCMQSLFNTKYI